MAMLKAQSGGRGKGGAARAAFLALISCPEALFR